MLLTLQAYQVYINSVLQFVAQVEDLPEEFDRHERKAVQALFPGPTGWMTPSFLKDSDYWGFPCALVDSRSVADAAKARVAYWENHAFGGLHVQSRAWSLLAQTGTNITLRHLGWVQGWAKNSFLRTLDRAREKFAAMVPSSALQGKGLA